ncbi:uncharacterized protein LOC113790047 [Dermatophagoides pteronyssinus]|uniref:uncharacterized protein LOC113790047 n=1 Tax=Dermatophagoides pteronyssinus TaxID=6956 RepID=UPI003F67B3DB
MMDHHQHNNNNQHGHHDLQQQHHIGHQYVHSHPLTHHQQSTTSYYQSNVIDPYMTESHLQLHGDNSTTTTTTSHQSTLNDNKNTNKQQQQKSLGSPSQQPYNSLSITAMSPTSISPVLQHQVHHHHHQQQQLHHQTTLSPSSSSSANIIDLPQIGPQNRQIPFNNNNSNSSSNSNSNHHYETPPLTITTYQPTGSPIAGSLLSTSSATTSATPSPLPMITDVSSGSSMVLNHHPHHHQQHNFINESISTSLTHISETTSDANETNYAITPPPLPLQSTNHLNHHHQQQQQNIGHHRHHLMKNSTPHNYHGSMAGWNHNHHLNHHHNQQQQQQHHSVTPDTPSSLPLSSNLNAQTRITKSSLSSINPAYSLQQLDSNDCFPFISTEQNSSTFLSTSINNSPINNNNNNQKNDSTFMVKTAIMNRKFLNNNNNNLQHNQQITQPLLINNDDPTTTIQQQQQKQRSTGNKLANDNDDDMKNRLFERRHLIIFKIIEQLVDPTSKTIVKENVQKNEEIIIDIGHTSFDDWNNSHKNHQNNDNSSNINNSTLLSNRSHGGGSSGLLADVSNLTMNTKNSSCSLIDSPSIVVATSSSSSSSSPSVDMIIDEDVKSSLKKSDQITKRSKDLSTKKSAKSNDNVDHHHQLVDESKDKEAATALLSLQKTPIKQSTIDLPSTTTTIVTADDDDDRLPQTVELKKSNDTAASNNIVIERLKPGMKIMAKWKDKNFYPAETIKQNETHRWMVRFEDNATRNLFENEIIRIEHLVGIKNQELMVKISDELCKASIVKKMIKLDDKNYQFDLEHSDDDDRTKVIKQYQLKDVFLYGEQGTILLNQFSKPSMMAAVFADVDLDNIVSGKRSRNSNNKKEDEKKKSTIVETSDSMSDNIVAAAIPTKKRKTINNISSNNTKSDHRSSTTTTVTSNNSTTTNRTLKNHSLSNHSLKTTSSNRFTSSIGHYHERSLSLSPPPPLRLTRSIELTIPQNELEKIFGPIPKSGSRLFQNFGFILTCGNNFNNNNNNINNNNNNNFNDDGLLDSNDSDSNPECSTPFDKTYLIKQIINGNGKVYESYEEMKKSSNECVCIADTYSRSIKFIQCLAGGISIVSHQWIIECCRQNRILDRESYILPAGYSIITNALSSDKSTFKRSSVLFKGAKFYFGSDQPDKLKQLWSPVLLAAQATIVPNDPNIHNTLQRGQIDIVIGDASCPNGLIQKAKQLKIPIVASEYIVQCLINGRKLSYDASPSFSYLHK